MTIVQSTRVAAMIQRRTLTYPPSGPVGANN
eukprot:CAMPEP_0196594288 /NCGR_PEP_ID=MMETSP1081-20130531/77893_1 /TAXON_ID=36882 /ORGANISM="Pyramimonas amylifera, Strain CCMP720" /LENGTH=30 /DNA_ID= /DNA_START= /DNA_END= /DNA_ORIENTATION=